jgi:hypothetical protein
MIVTTNWWLQNLGGDLLQVNKQGKSFIWAHGVKDIRQDQISTAAKLMVARLIKKLPAFY